MTPEETFAKRMRQVRERRRWTQTQLADWIRVEGIDLHPTAITRIESGERSVRLNEAVAAASALNVQLEELLKPITCESCGDVPPKGFTCQKCKRDG